MDFEGCGYDSNGNKMFGSEELPYGESFEVGDIIRCCIDLEEKFTISYFKNGLFLGHAYKLKEKMRNKAYYPHICLRNMALEINFGQEPEYCQVVTQIYDNSSRDGKRIRMNASSDEEEKDDSNCDTIDITPYKFIDQATVYQIEVSPDPPQSFKECTMIMLIGLPGCGKTSYARKFTENNFKKNYQILGTFETYEHIVSTFRVPFLKQNILILMEICNDIFQKSLRIASQCKKNYIIDQCNVYLKSRLEKLALFKEFRKNAYVIVLSEQEYMKRFTKQQKALSNSGCLYPRACTENIRHMKENFILPIEGEFDGIKYLALEEDKARQALMLSRESAQLQIHPLLRQKNYLKMIEAAATKQFKASPKPKRSRPAELISDVPESQPMKSISLFPGQNPSSISKPSTVRDIVSHEPTLSPTDPQSLLEKKKAVRVAARQDQISREPTTIPAGFAPYSFPNNSSSQAPKFVNAPWLQANQSVAGKTFGPFGKTQSPQGLNKPGGNFSYGPTQNQAQNQEVDAQEQARLIRQYEQLKSQLQPATISFDDQPPANNTK